MIYILCKEGKDHPHFHEVNLGIETKLSPVREIMFAQAIFDYLERTHFTVVDVEKAVQNLSLEFKSLKFTTSMWGMCESDNLWTDMKLVDAIISFIHTLDAIVIENEECIEEDLDGIHIKFCGSAIGILDQDGKHCSVYIEN